MKIILASKSPRRSEILSNLGIQFQVIASDFDESVNDELGADNTVKYLAYKKAESVAETVSEAALIIGADTVVVLDSIIMGKPRSEQEAFKMLKRLSGKWHKVYSGICVLDSSSGRHLVEYETTSVKIKNLSDRDILSYIGTKEPLDKAGSYAIQGIGSLIVERIDGCYFNVVGLPVFRLSNLMRQFGVDLLIRG